MGVLSFPGASVEEFIAADSTEDEDGQRDVLLRAQLSLKRAVGGSSWRGSPPAVFVCIIRAEVVQPWSTYY